MVVLQDKRSAALGVCVVCGLCRSDRILHHQSVVGRAGFMTHRTSTLISIQGWLNNSEAAAPDKLCHQDGDCGFPPLLFYFGCMSCRHTYGDTRVRGYFFFFVGTPPTRTLRSGDAAARLYPQHKLRAAVINKAKPRGVDIN